jgi:hypothetical protein
MQGEDALKWYKATWNKDLPIDISIFTEYWPELWPTYFCEAIVQSKHFNSAYITNKNLFGISDAVGDNDFKLRPYRQWRSGFKDAEAIYKGKTISKVGATYLAALTEFAKSQKVSSVPRPDGTYPKKDPGTTVITPELNVPTSDKVIKSIVFWLGIVAIALLPLSYLNKNFAFLRNIVIGLKTILEQLIKKESR